MHSLETLAATLAARSTPVTVFFRNDDVGWANDRLRPLCKLMSEVDVELDLAVIPGSLDQPTSAEVIRLSREYGHVLNFHQHGYAHVNHQLQGRKCEFGSDRHVTEQRQDIDLGRKRLHEVLGELVDPIFTPPWNRVTSQSCKVLKELDFIALSRISGSEEIEQFGLVELSVAIDWQKKRKGAVLRWVDFCHYAERCLMQGNVVGVMLHHEMMSDDDLARLRKFILCLGDTGKVQFRPMLQIVESIDAKRQG